jgi:hypothetical protein
MDNASPDRDRWAQDLAILNAVVDLAAPGTIVLPGEIAEHLRQPEETVQESLRRLAGANPPFAQFSSSSTFGSGIEVDSVTQPTERALRTTGVWASAETAVDRIADALEGMLAQATTEDERSRIRRALDWVRGGARDFLIQAVATALQINAAG